MGMFFTPLSRGRLRISGNHGGKSLKIDVFCKCALNSGFPPSRPLNNSLKSQPTNTNALIGGVAGELLSKKFL